MFAEFAVEPAAMVTNIDRFRGMIDRFGVEHGRIVSDFAEGRWSAAVIQHALANGLGDVALASVEERLRQKRDQKGIARFGRAYPGAAGGWITNALEADAVQPFAGIVVEQSCGHERECCAATAHSNQPPLHVAGFIDIPRNAAEIAAVAAPLIRLSRKLHLIDPHITFDGTAQVISKWVNPLVALLGECRPAMEVTIHTYATGNGKPPAYLFEQHARARLQPLPAGVGVRLQRWVRRNGGEDFHDRAILTDIGGMTFGNGLDEGAPGTRVGVQRLDRHGWMTWSPKFTPETSPFDAEAPIVLQQVGGAVTDRPYLSASIDELEAAFDKASEFAEFKAIADELQHRKTARAGKLRMRVVLAMGKARKGEGHAPSPGLPLFKAMIAAAEPTPSPSPPPPPRSSPLGALLARFDLEAPDGRPLHRLRLGDAGYDDLPAAVRARAGRLEDGRIDDAALLVLWASAWFRREYAGGLRKYRDLGREIGASITDTQWRELIERGLKWWKRPLIERTSGRQRLLTVAVEGGFPVRVLASGEGWLSRYLNEVVGRLLGLTEEPSPDDAFAMADAARDVLRETYRQDAFIALAADLALAIVKLRRIAEATAPGLTPSTVLDQVRPGWRDELPIAAESDAARTLIDGMLAAAKIARGLSGGAGCVRVLRRHEQCWRAGLRLSLAGELKGDVLAGLASAGTRLGVHPHGALARAVGEELAFLDPPGEDGEDWRLRPLTRRTELDGVPLEARIEVLLQSPRGAARVMPWPGGAPEQSDVVTFEIDAEDDDGPNTLLLAANGSASLRAERVVVTAPSDWQVTWQDGDREGTPDRIGVTDDGRGLWLADGAVLIESTDGGLLYCVETGVDEELRDRIVLNGSSPQGLDGADDVPLFAGRPAVQCYRGRAIVQPASEELLWRQSRSEPWRALARSSLPSGVVDIMWRDARTRFVRDRVRAAIIPSGARVSRERDGDGWRYSFEGFGDFEVSPEPVEGLRVEHRTGGSLALSFHSNPRRCVTFNLRSEASARAIRIELPFPLTDGLAHWDGRLVRPGSTLTAAELGELVAFSEGSITLCSELKHAEIVVPAHYTLGERELALRPLADRIATDLATGGIDAWVELSFLGSTNMPYRIQPFDSSLCCESGWATILNVPGLGGVSLQVTGRCLDAPHEEHGLAEPSLEDVLNRRPIQLPDHMTGAWLVYLRTGRLVRSRPTIVPCGLSRSDRGSGLAAAATIASPAERRAAIRACLECIGASENDVQDDVAWLHRLIASLDGVPAATFDALTALPESPRALALLLLAAPDESVQAAVWRLESELPFLWAALPRNAWQSAVDALGSVTIDALRLSGLDEGAAASIAREAVTAAVKRVATLDSAVAFALSSCGIVCFDEAVPTLLDATGGYVRRTWDRGELAVGLPRKDSLFRAGDLQDHLPEWFKERYDLTHLEALDAPLAVAAAAQGVVALSLAQIRRCKAAMIEDPIYFAEGFAAALVHGFQERQQVA